MMQVLCHNPSATTRGLPHISPTYSGRKPEKIVPANRQRGEVGRSFPRLILRTYHRTSTRRSGEFTINVRLFLITPLSVRGVNYYPRETPWDGMWTKRPADRENLRLIPS